MALKNCIKTHIMLFPLLLILLFLPHNAYALDSYIYVTDSIIEDTIWDNTSSVYSLNGNIAIQQGASLTISSGVMVDGNNYTIDIYGTLNINGATLSNTSIALGKSSSNDSVSFTMQNSSFSNGSLLSPSGASTHAHIELRDNIITDTLDYTYVWYPVDDTYITGNSFVNFGGFSIGSNYDVYICNNTFHGHNSCSNALIEDWAQYNNSNCFVQYNKFDYPGIVLKLPSGYSSAKMIADHNYWFTNMEEAITSRIYDYNDDFGSAAEIPYLPIVDEAGKEQDIIPMDESQPPIVDDEFVYVEGQIISDTSWSETTKVYKLTGDISIKQGVSLTICPGVVINGNNHSIKVYGSLDINGATLSATSLSIGNNNSTDPTSIVMKNSSFSNGGLFQPTGQAANAHIELTDNQITSTIGYTYIWYPVDSTYITGNTFTNFGGFSIGSNYDVYIYRNIFHGSNTSSRALIENWAQYRNSNCYVRYNRFDYTGIVLKLPSGYSSASIMADHNYWYTNNESEIAARIYDYNDDFGSAATITYLPLLSVINLPSSTVSIEAEAFDNTTFEYVIIPYSCNYIGEKAFSGCSKLLYVEIPQNCVVASNAFDGCPNIVIIRY